ncbi:MAG: HD domain-containing protein [Cryomorphaceae bacterium]
MTTRSQPLNKRKILNDPVYGFITVPDELIFDLIEHPDFQRLRRIKQVGMSHLVYPGALHTRFHHALGAMHLMGLAILNLRDKGVVISAEEALGAKVAILLHDIGHGPFSHSLEFSIVKNVNHEVISGLLMERLNAEFGGKLTTGIEIFRNEYPKKFLHQLVSGQLDMDRLDYLSRDSFYSGVSEGVVSNQRIIKMLNVRDDRLVVEQKGIYSIEKFIMARRLMYWQVYLHKTVVAAERLLINILKRAKYCARNSVDLFASPALKYFLYNDFGRDDFRNNAEVLNTFVQLDDFDIMGALKVWQQSEDPILSVLCKNLVNRRLPRVILTRAPFTAETLDRLKTASAEVTGVAEADAEYFFQTDYITNHAYAPGNDGIYFLGKDGRLIDLAEATDNPGSLTSNETVKKHVLYLPKEVDLSGVV